MTSSVSDGKVMQAMDDKLDVIEKKVQKAVMINEVQPVAATVPLLTGLSDTVRKSDLFRARCS